MEEKLIMEAVKQVPALAVLVFIVVYFLRYLSKRDDVHRERSKEFAAYFAVIQAEHLAARKESRDAIVDNTAATRALSEGIVELRLQLKNGNK